MKRDIRFTVEKDRVLVPVGEPCPFGCRYCYTRGGEVGPARTTEDDILSRFQQFAHHASFETIQFGYDGDPFARPERGIAMLTQLARMHKHVNFSTKALLDGPLLDQLDEIQRTMQSVGTTLSAQISLSCWDSAPLVEPHTPSPAERVQTLANLKRIGVPAFIALRPILPHIPDQEYERIADEGIRAGSEGFVLGPLYADKGGRFVRFIPPASLSQVPAEIRTVSWSAHAPRWKRYEDVTRLHRLLQMIEQKGGRTFLSSADAVVFMPQMKKVA